MDIRNYMVSKKEEIKELEVRPRLIDVDLNKSFIVSVVGPRRVGKTFFLYYLIKRLNLREKDYLFINFEEVGVVKDPHLLPLVHKEIYGKLPEFVFFDEIQSLKNWEKIVYRLYESKRYHIFLTGSSSKFLAKEIATQLRGRSYPLYVYPLSFKEVLSFREFKFKKEDVYSSYKIAEIKNLLFTVLERGTFPDIVLNNLKFNLFFKEYWDLLVHKDASEQYGIRNRYALEFFIKSLLASFTKETSMRKTLNILGSQGVNVSKTTLYNFQKILEDMRIFFFLRKLERGIKRVELAIPKVYSVDNGLYTFFERKKDMGKLMENFVFLELIKRGIEENKDLFYFRDYQQHEVDFVIKEGPNVKHLIQVSYASSKDEIDRREIRALIKARDVFKADNPDSMIITWDYEDVLKEGNTRIKCTPLWKWLLERDAPNTD